MTKKEQEIMLIVEYFKALRNEIDLRIGEHTRLVWIKIVSLGVIISFLMERFYVSGAAKASSASLPLPTLYLVWIIPLAAVIFDMLIASNLRDINNLGYYIKKYLEGKAFVDIKHYVNKKLQRSGKSPDFGFWEEKAGHAALEYRCYTQGDMIVIWLFTLASLIFSGLLRWQIGFTLVDAILAICSLIGTSFALKCLICSITLERRF